MFTIKYTVFNVDTLTEKQRARYERWQTVRREEIIKQYGTLYGGATLSMETYREMLAREAYEDSLLEEHDRLIMRVGHYIEAYFSKYGDKASCGSVYLVDSTHRLEDEMLSPNDRFYQCYLRDWREAIVRVSGKHLSIIQAFCNRQYQSEDDDQPF